MSRGFIAIRPPDGVLDALEREVASVRTSVSDVRWSVREQWHITVRFLGNAVDLDAVAAALPALAVSPAHVQLGRAGTFPARRRAEVLWIGAVLGDDFLVEVHHAIEAGLALLGYEPEPGEFRPHLTLARARHRPVVARPFVAAMPDLVGDRWFVDHVTLFESRLLPTGAEHVARAEIPLGP